MSVRPKTASLKRYPKGLYKQSKTPEEYLNQRVKKGGQDECWLWQIGVDKDGYGQCQASSMGKLLGVSRAHQMAYVTWVGPNPDKLFVCHTCDNPTCCNPNHLFLGTNQDNVTDMVQKGRAKSGMKPKLDYPAIVSCHGTHSSTEVAEMFGTSFGTVCKIWRKHGLKGRSHFGSKEQRAA